MANTSPNAKLRFSNGLFASTRKPGLELLSQDAFRQAIRLEQKRTERSRRKFLLMLATCAASTAVGRREEVAAAWSTLAHASRETDITGWYEDGATLGMVFTEIGVSDAEVKVAQQRISHRMVEVLQKALDKDQFDRLDLSFYLFPDDWDRQGSDRFRTNTLDERSDRDANGKPSLIAKRAMDILGSASALLLLSPIMIVIAVAIKLTSHGPVLFRQERVGRYGNAFIFLKFRSMRSGNDSAVHQEYMKSLIAGSATDHKRNGDSGPVFKIVNDPRVTPLGRFLRRTSLDELPQFINVLQGDMSLVGPRPPIPYEVECYELWHRRRLQTVKPGITGLWQVSGRSSVKFDDMVRLDLKYARSWSTWLDMKILLKTAGAVLRGEGAY